MLFDKITQELTAAIYYAGLRHRVIANNIANADTPGYKALDVSFRDQLDILMRTGGGDSRVDHLPSPTLVFCQDPTSAEPRPDLNTVNLDLEMAKLSQNGILHNTYLQILNNKFRILKYAISGNV